MEVKLDDCCRHVTSASRALRSEGHVITLAMIYKRINLLKIPLILCTNSYLLYQCLVQLGTTSEKRLMIDIMAFRQSYEGREIDEIR